MNIITKLVLLFALSIVSLSGQESPIQSSNELPPVGKIPEGFSYNFVMQDIPKILTLTNELPLFGTVYRIQGSRYGGVKASMKVTDEFKDKVFGTLNQILQEKGEGPLEKGVKDYLSRYNPPMDNEVFVINFDSFRFSRGDNIGNYSFKVKGIAHDTRVVKARLVRTWALILESPELNQLRKSSSVPTVDSFYLIIGHQEKSPQWQ